MLDFNLQYPPPRSIRRRAGRGYFIGCVHIFILPHTCVGIGVLIAAVWCTVIALAIALVGEVVPGKITERHKGRAKNGPTYNVRFGYQAGITNYSESCSVSASAFDQLPEGTPIQVRILPALPSANPQMIGPGAPHPWATVGMLWVFALFWNAFMSLFVWAIYVEPWLKRKLVINGMATVGTIVQKETKSGKSTSYLLHYEYEVPGVDPDGMETGTPEKRREKMSVRTDEYNAAEKGGAELVLYNPKRPKRSLLYRYADYEVKA